MAKCRILKRFGENFVKNVGRRRNMVCRKKFKFGFIGALQNIVFRHAFSLTRLRAGAPSRREP